MVKSYLRYEEKAAFGVVVSPESNIEYDASGKLLLAGALEQFVVWNARQGQRVHGLSPTALSVGARPAVTSLLRLPTSSSLVAVGYADGSLRFWNIVSGICDVTLTGHKAATTCLRCTTSGSTLASGSKDTTIIVWDVVGEVGLFSLRGHRDQVTDVVFMEKGKKLVSCSKDTFIRVWDLDTQSCVQTVVGHRGEIWSLDVDSSERHLVTGSTDPELRVYEIGTEGQGGEGDPQHDEALQDQSKRSWKLLKETGVIKRHSSERVVTVRFNETGTLLGCQVAGKSLEIYRVLDKTQTLKKLKRREKRKREKASKSAGVDHGNKTMVHSEKGSDQNGTVSDPGVQVSDEFQFLQTIRTKHKVRSFSFSPLKLKRGPLARVALALHNNSIQVYDLEEEAASSVGAIEFPGHRSDIRTAKLSADGMLLMTTSHNAVKIWNPQTCCCLRTVESGYGLCGIFVPGNRFSVVGTKAGHLEIIDIGGAERSQVLDAHTGAVWSISPMPNGSGFVTGSADHDVKFWDYNYVEGTKQLSVHNSRTLRMSEDVLSVCLSPDAKFLAVALLDSTIKVFFVDSLKFFLSLYGHKLPVLGMDISSDGALLVSGSADKNVKIWGMDFGDCHKSLFAHSDSVMAVQFVPNTHYVFTVGKDSLVKYWDADTFESLLTLEGHHAEVWCLAVSIHGDFIVTGSHDRSIRRWDCTDEPFFIEEEREKRLESLFEALPDDSRNGQSVAGDQVEDGAVGVAGRPTQASLGAVDSLIEGLEMAETERERLFQYKKEKEDNKNLGPMRPNPLLLSLSPSEYVLRVICGIQPSDMEQALLMLPFMDALKLMGYLKDWLLEGNQHIELICRVAVLLLHIHYQQLMSTTSARLALTQLHAVLRKSAQWIKDTMGYNLAALGHIQRLLEARGDLSMKDAITNERKARAKLQVVKEKIMEKNFRRSKKRRKQ